MTRRTLMLGYIVVVMLACIICTGIQSCGGGPRTDPGSATQQAVHGDFCAQFPDADSCQGR